jgi:hypothetical protein
MDCWEYQVIHINVEPPKPSLPTPGGEASMVQDPPAAEGGGAKPFFSETFLKREFPKFYEKPAETSEPQSQHPAQQLQTFLNGQGTKGWEMVGVFPVGNLTMMFFRRLKPADPIAPVAVPAVSEAPIPVESSLQQLLGRMEALEQRLSSPRLQDSATPPPQPASMAQPGQQTQPADHTSLITSLNRQDSPQAVQSVVLVSPDQLATLSGETPVPSSVAAQAIGLRSATSLANHGARYGYNPGLSKMGPNGMVAIYTGPGASESGGKERRLWIVVPAERLTR